MKRRNMLIGTLCVFVILLLLSPNVDARNNNCQKIAGITEAGPREYKEPAVSATEDLLAIVYTYRPYNEGGSTTYEIRMVISFDGGLTFSTLHTKVNEKNNECRYPDVLVTKKHFCDNEYDVIYVVWQEKVNDKWQINSQSFFIGQNNNPVVMDGERYLSTPTGDFLDSIYPRIEGGYIPYYKEGIFHKDSATIVMVAWQQDYDDPGNYRIRCCFKDYQTHYSTMRAQSHSNTAWTIPFDWPNQPLSESERIVHPSIDVQVNRMDSSQYSHPKMDFAMSFEQRKTSTGGTYEYNGCVNGGHDQRLNTVNPTYPSTGFSMSTLRRYNLVSNGWCYPDVAYICYGGTVYQTVAFQDPDDNDAKVDATHHAHTDPEMTLGPCKTPTLRGISIDHITPEYFSSANSGERSGWTNPGGITVIWRSDVTIPDTQNTYGVDSVNLEYKNNHLRVIHYYYRVLQPTKWEINRGPWIFQQKARNVDNSMTQCYKCQQNEYTSLG